MITKETIAKMLLALPQDINIRLSIQNFLVKNTSVEIYTIAIYSDNNIDKNINIK